MTRTYKNKKAVLGAGLTTIYTCPAGVSAIVCMAQASNVNAGAVSVTASWNDATDGVSTELVSGASIAQGASLGLLSGPLFLEGGDSLQGLCSVASGSKVTLSVIERS